MVSVTRILPYVEIRDYKEDPTIKPVVKQIEKDGQWVPVNFYKMRCTTEMEEWCRKKYGASKYLSDWFLLPTAGYIVMNEKTYLHWKLCE